MPGILIGLAAVTAGGALLGDKHVHAGAVFVIVLGVITFLVGLDSLRERS